MFTNFVVACKNVFVSHERNIHIRFEVKRIEKKVFGERIQFRCMNGFLAFLNITDQPN